MRELVDAFGRVHRDLRISLTDKCNLRCSYCMPEFFNQWIPSKQHLTTEELVSVIDVAAANTTAGLENLKGLLEIVRSAPRAAERGALAFVIDGERGDLVRELATLNRDGERPVQVFTSLHEARRWLDSQPLAPPPR